MEEITVSKFKATCPEVLRRVRRTRKPVRVTRYGVAIAEVNPVSIKKKRKSWLGSMAGTAEILGDIVGPLSPAEEWSFDEDKF